MRVIFSLGLLRKHSFPQIIVTKEQGSVSTNNSSSTDLTELAIYCKVLSLGGLKF